MTDFNELVRAAMAKGESMEDIIADFTIEVQALKEREKRKREQEEAKKYDKYTKSVAHSFRSGSDVMDNFISGSKIPTHDMAVVFAHFMCQNVPGYAEVLAKTNTDPLALYENILDDQIKVAKVVVKHKDDSPEDAAAALINRFLDEAFGNSAKDSSSPDGNVSKSVAKAKEPPVKIRSLKYSSPFDAEIKFTPTETDAEKIAAFMKKYCLF